MPFFKWKAYDFDLKYHDGAIKCDRFERVVIELAQKSLVASEIVEIDYAEYKRLKLIEKRLNALKLKEQPREVARQFKINWTYIKIGLIIGGSTLLLVLAWLKAATS
jgi:hypothetical protein